MHLEALLIGNVACKLYIQNPRYPEISLVLITLCPRNIILVYLACEKLSHYIILSFNISLMKLLYIFIMYICHNFVSYMH